MKTVQLVSLANFILFFVCVYVDYLYFGVGVWPLGHASKLNDNLS